MVRSRIGLPSMSTPPEREALALLDACIRALVDAAVALARTVRPTTLACVVALGGCGPGQLIDVEGIVRDGRSGAPIAGALVSSEDGTTAETGDDGRFTLAVEEGSSRRLTAMAVGRCPAVESVDVTRSGVPEVVLHLFDRIQLDTEYVQVGFDSDVRVELELRCEADTPIEWEQIGGPTLESENLRIEDRGRVVVVHTHPLEERVQLDDRIGVIALDREQRSEYRLRMRATFGDEVDERVVRIVSAPLAAGLFQVPTGADVYLNGGNGDRHDWSIASRPNRSEAELSDASVRTPYFRPDRFGTYVIEHGATSLQMSLQAGPYEDVPRDCGREGCHQLEDQGWAGTAHARTFRRGMDGELGPDFTERCWSCHATGVDFGINNGGLHHTAARVGWVQPSPSPDVWDAMPRRVRRRGSVWCSACHGPGRIVPPPFRWQYGSKFQVGVCARCHDVDPGDPDANHRSPHVDEWRLSPMSSFARDLGDQDPATRAECASCHSAQGFVSWRRTGARTAPERDTVEPLTCATCHDAHDTTNPRGLRVYDTSDSIAGRPAEDLGAGALCAACHQTAVAWEGAVDSAPHASQTSLLVGRGARTARDVDAGAHRYIANTCVRCHMTRPDPDDPTYARVGGHTFSVRARTGEPVLSLAACSPCHGEMRPDTIGAGDWDGDQQLGPLAEEHDRSMSVTTEALRARILSANVRDACPTPRTASDVVDSDARLHLVDAQGSLLGDCDDDGRIGEGETGTTIAALPRATADAAWDVALLRADGSRGVHNPAYVFSIFAAVQARLH